MSWEYDPLWQKSKVYADRAIEERRDSPLFPFWCSLTLEFLARATLARIHPALLADPRGDDSMLFAFGFPAKRPVSVPMKTVLSRCKALIPELTDNEVRAATILVERRNVELHTGEPAFVDLPTSLWLADFYRTCHRLLTHQEKDLADLFGSTEAGAAKEMLAAADQAVLDDAKQRQGVAASKFSELDPEEQERRRVEGGERARRQKTSRAQIVRCPSCGADALVKGELIAETSHRLEGDEIVQDDIILPTRLVCHSCGLELPSHGALHAFQLGGQFRVEWRMDAVEYYSEQIDPADFFEPDYGND